MNKLVFRKRNIIYNTVPKFYFPLYTLLVSVSMNHLQVMLTSFFSLVTFTSTESPEDGSFKLKLVVYIMENKI